MNSQSIILFDYEELFNILDEVKSIVRFKIFNITLRDKKMLIDEKKYGNFLVLVKKNSNIEKIISNINNNKIIRLEKLPIKLENLIDTLNIKLLKQEYNLKSEIRLKKYIVDLNSREIKNQDKRLKLTEKEINIILFLQSKKNPQKIDILQKEVWGYLSGLDTHTVETHIYRLRKKIKDVFGDDKFILSKKNGYTV